MTTNAYTQFTRNGYDFRIQCIPGLNSLGVKIEFAAHSLVPFQQCGYVILDLKPNSWSITSKASKGLATRLTLAPAMAPKHLKTIYMQGNSARQVNGTAQQVLTFYQSQASSMEASNPKGSISLLGLLGNDSGLSGELRVNIRAHLEGARRSDSYLGCIGVVIAAEIGALFLVVNTALDSSLMTTVSQTVQTLEDLIVGALGNLPLVILGMLSVIGLAYMMRWTFRVPPR